MATPMMLIRPGNPGFLDLEWGRPIDEWQGGRRVEMPEGIHRHPVVFVAYPVGVYAIKELPQRAARHEYEMLRMLADRTTRTARPAGLVERRWLDPDTEGSGAVITRYVEHAFPYRELVTGGGFGGRRNQMLDAFAGLLVELHLAGCYWGDCSLSNVLYRYDAASIAAVMVDAETARLHSTLSSGQREEDLAIMEYNVAGGMADVAAEQGLDLDRSDLALGEDISTRYRSLWDELTTDLIIGPDESFRIAERVARLNDLGFEVDDVTLQPRGDGSDRVGLSVAVGGRTYNSHRLRELTGIDAAEGQAKQILADLSYHEHKFGGVSATGKAVATMKWRATVFEPLIAQIRERHPEADPLQAYADFLNYRYVLAVAAGHDIDNDEAFTAWEAAGYPGYDPS